uniref:Conotoxin-like unassigned superfamily 03 n=1 Tax=Conus ermineus TaxID=55423 RepID=A0A346CJ08_CONER|nr:conotoxin-like precursor unassigned superfamily 03 [Conus ermineus]
MKLSMMFILSLVLTLSMTDGFILLAKKGGRTFREHSPDSMDLQTRQLKRGPSCPEDCKTLCLYDGICQDE